MWRIFVDFDGTITLEDSTDRILEEFADPEWRDVEAAWKNGQIGSRECMARQVGLIRASAAALDDFVADLAVDASFPAFAADCRRRGLPVAIVSDGLDRVIHAVASKHGFGGLPIHANELVPVGADRWRLNFPYAKESCRSQSGTCKCAIAATPPKGAIRHFNLLIGDGQSDFCASVEMDYVFAKRRLLAHCHETGIAHQAFGTFADVGRMFAALVDPVATQPSRHPHREQIRNV